MRSHHLPHINFMNQKISIYDQNKPSQRNRPTIRKIRYIFNEFVIKESICVDKYLSESLKALTHNLK